MSIKSNRYILSIDQGTQSARALLFDVYGNLIAKGKKEIEPYFSTEPGWAEQHPEYYWQAVGSACEKLWQELGKEFNRNQIIAVAVTTQRGTVINVDKQGKPLRPAILWLDQRNASIEKPLPWIWKWLFKIARVEDIVNRFREKCQALWIAQNQPEIWAKTHKYLLLSGYLNYQLTGNFADSISSQVGYIPFDYKKLKWASTKDWRYAILPEFDPSKLPELKAASEKLGTITYEASSHTGIPQGVPVFAAASDKACEIIGSGADNPETACLSYGTAATINTTNIKYIEPIKYMPAFPSAIHGKYNSEVMIYRGFWMVSWFKKEFGLREQTIATERGIPPEQLFDELVNKVPAGSMGLMLQAYWTPGTRDPGPEAKGGIIGFGDVHTRAHIYRAILEGLAYGLKEGKERLEKRNGARIKSIRVSGGGSQSDAAMQLTADIFNLPAERPHTYETSGLGAAIDAAVGIGEYASFDDAIKNMTRVGEVFEPNRAQVELYDRLYREVYLKMYKQLQPLYRKIRDITGYPQ